MKRAFLFAMLGFVIFCIMLGVVALNMKKATQVSAAPAPIQTVAPTVQPSATPMAAQTSEAPTNDPTTESPSPTASESVDEETDMSNYTPHKLPMDMAEWTDQEWQWYSEASDWFIDDYKDIYKAVFESTPSEKFLKSAQDFAEGTCYNFDNGATLDEVSSGIVNSGGSQHDQASLALAVKPGVTNFCPWNDYVLS